MAGGKGTRMQSATPKVRHLVSGLPMVVYPVLAAQQAGAEKVVVITGPDDDLKDILPDGTLTATQHEALGTGDAVKSAQEAIGDAQQVLILSADVPLIDEAFITGLAERQAESGAAMVVATAVLDDATGYGRIVRDPDGHIEHVAETKVAGDATTAELAINEVNAGIYAFDRAKLFAALEQVGSDNAQGEFYLPDVLPILRAQGEHVVAYELSSPDHMLGVNDRADLGLVQRLMNAADRARPPDHRRDRDRRGLHVDRSDREDRPRHSDRAGHLPARGNRDRLRTRRSDRAARSPTARSPTARRSSTLTWSKPASGRAPASVRSCNLSRSNT